MAASQEKTMRLTTPEGNRPPSRRVVAASLFTAGYALAAASATAEPIVTPTDNIITEDVRFAGAAGYQLPAYLARPKTRGRHAAIIVVNEVFGIHAYIKDVCHRFANAGFVALAPDYFDRAGDPSTLRNFDEIRPIVAAATYPQVMGDTQGAITWLKASAHSAPGKLGITGFCWGGAVVWMGAARFADIKAGVAWYGRLVAPPAGQFGAEAGRPWPVDIAPSLHTPVLGLYGDQDGAISAADIAAMRAALASTGNPSGSQIIVYPGAGHGFHADYRDSYNAAAATDGWARALAWFRANGVG
jgi:carboxymethylenebutenolidase